MKKIAYSLMMIAALVACTVDEQGTERARQGQTISFAVTEGSQWQTRGAVSTDSRQLALQSDSLDVPLSLTATVVDGMAPRRGAAGQWAATRGTKVTTTAQIEHFGVSAFLQKTTDASLGTPGYFYNLEASKSGDDYVITQNYFWPAADECLHFYAYYPYGDANVVLSGQDAEGPQSIRFTVDPAVASQVDLMTAVAVDAATPQAITQPTVTLPFRHELCAVSFKIADALFPATGGIVSVALKNVYGSGTMTINQGADGTWSFKDSNNADLEKTSFTATINKDNTQNLDANGKLVADDLTFLMIPQELQDDAVIELVYQDQRQNYTLTASLKDALLVTDSDDPAYGRAFLEAGKTVTFALSSTTLSTLKVGTVGWPAAYSQSLPKGGYASGDQAGLYIVAADNTTITHVNVPVTFDGSNWNVDHATAYGTIYYDPSCHYYLYYPYTATPNTDYPLQGQGEGGSTLDVDFFSSLVTGWGRTVYSPQGADADRRDQSQQADFIAADLHIGELTAAGGGGYVSTIGGTMKHAMGLAVFTLGTTSNVPQIVHRSLDTDATFIWNVPNGTTSVTASGSFNGKTYIPYKLDGTTYLYWVKPAQSTSVSSEGADAWSETVSVAANASATYAEQSPRTSVETNETVSEAELSFTVGSATFKVIAVGGGSYNTSWSRYNEYTVSNITGTLTSYWLGQTEVTNGLWNAVMGSKPSSQTNNGDTYPVAMVSWINIMGDGDSADGTASGCFMKKLNDAVATQLATYGLSGRRFTLPSEAQWQWAAEGGLKSTGTYTYAGSNDLNSVAWNSSNSNSQTHPVAQKAANELKLYDMTGNVWEWCRDWYCSQSEIVTSQGTDYVRTTKASSSARVNRGGGWGRGTDWCPVSRRSHSTPSHTDTGLGLRLLLQ